MDQQSDKKLNRHC